ncbi:MAG TPA: hemerythrin domain-containing protein [Syntrophobacteraceae bacterium]|nr:hemerythrin domain-containing protein [Syntrophobacteraceae bacterium]
MSTGTITSRRRFLCLTGGLAAGVALPAITSPLLAAAKNDDKVKAAGVNPVEDLMREHGVLRRVLLIYEEAIRRIDKKKDLPSGVIADSAGIIRSFVEDYHEKLEENEVFPRLEKAAKLDDLVKVLFVQHQAGRSLTDSILKLSTPEVLKIPEAKQKWEDEPAAVRQIYEGRPLLFREDGTLRGRPKSSEASKKDDLSSAMRQFVHLYRPHAAWEDTVLFPVFHSILSPKEFEVLGEKFEDREEDLFGKDGFEKMVDKVAEIEKKLGIHDLSGFTPKI